MLNKHPAKKICFFLQRRFAFVGHALAYNLDRYFNVHEFCAYVSQRPGFDFLASQKDIAYSSLLLDEEIFKSLKHEVLDFAYLAQLEKEYGIPNLWPYLYIDRIVMSGQLLREYPYDKAFLSYTDMLKLLQLVSKKIIAFLEKERPDAIVISVIGCLPGMLLYNIARKKNILAISVDTARIGNRITISSDYRTFSWTDDAFQELQKKERASPKTDEAKQFLEEFRNKPAPYHEQASPEYHDQTKRKANVAFLKPGNFFTSLRWHLGEILRSITRKQRDYTDISIWWLMWDKMKRKVRGIIGYEDLYSNVRDDDRVIFFPLQYEPEITTALYAPSYTNQVNVIRQIARSLPVSYVLYVKEHPAMVGYRTRRYYKEILKNPNVRLIRPTYPGHALVRRSALTITMSGTSGWESILFKKPVITFGDVFYNELSFVKRCRSFDDLPQLIREQLENFTHREDELVNYISALMENSVPVDYFDLWYSGTPVEKLKINPGIKDLAGLIASKLSLNCKETVGGITTTAE